MNLNSATLSAVPPSQDYVKTSPPKRGSVIVRSCCCGCTLGQGTVAAGIVSTIESTLLIVFGIVLLVLKDEGRTRSEIDYYLRLGIIAVVQGSVIFMASICLFFAVKMKRRNLLLPWLISQGTLLVINIVGPIVLLIMGYRTRSVGGGMVFTILMIYLFVVVFSYHQSDMGRTLDRTGLVLIPSPQLQFGAAPQTYYGNSFNTFPGAPAQGPPGDCNAYPCPAPIAPFYPPNQGVPPNLVPLYPTVPNPYLQSAAQTQELPPPYSPNLREAQRPREQSPKRF